MTADRPPAVLSLFWAPVCAIGSHGPAGPNAQVCVSVAGASIVPEKPRVIVGLYRTNLTTSLVAGSGTLAISVLGASQVDLLEPLGLRSGHDGPKLETLDYALTAAGDPYFPASPALVDCRVIDAVDAGDALFFLCAVVEHRWLTDEPPVDRLRAMELAGEAFRARWAEKQAREHAASRATMRW